MYVGRKGLTIPKSDLSAEVRKKIIGDLTFAPKQLYVPAPPFYCYRESENKLYLPRFYGGYQAPEQLPAPVRVAFEFKGGIRENQVPAAEAFLEAKCGLLELPCGFGKTVIALYIMARLGVKTLIIVHKEFLLQQWTERIQEFLPGATIGLLRGGTVDTGKDITIGMLQSISMKEYDPAVFAGIGLTIIDETHHVAAEVFSNALFKIVTPYMLGLSATMERADGLTKVFKLFLGEIVFSAQREKTDNVVVQQVMFLSDDEKFNEVVLNFKGQAQYSVMINKLTDFAPRRAFLMRVLRTLVATPQNRQIMVLSQTKSLLEDLHRDISQEGLASVGYYVGGMKTAALKASEGNRIILATYAMAEEALDIKTLTTLLMATPKNNVTQAVGRILRVKHEQPLVVDIVDPHYTFTNQWKKRQTFYRGNNYTIVKYTSETYPVPK